MLRCDNGCGGGDDDDDDDETTVNNGNRTFWFENASTADMGPYGEDMKRKNEMDFIIVAALNNLNFVMMDGRSIDNDIVCNGR